jgi:hypothetical protein
MDRDGIVTPEEVAAAADYLKDTMGKEEGVQELISNLSKDRGSTLAPVPTLLTDHSSSSLLLFS